MQFQQSTATPSADFGYSRLAIAINSRPVTARALPQASHKASDVFTERVNKRAYHLQSSIICGYPCFLTTKKYPTSATSTFSLSKNVHASSYSHLDWYFVLGKGIKRVTPCGYV
jgi:hypothetical protein